VLTGILGHVSFLKTILPASGQHIESLVAIEEGARKASSMTQQILNFSKQRSEEKPTQVDLGALLQSTAKLLKGAIPTACKLTCSLPRDRLMVLAVEGRLIQIIINLVVNARDAVGPTGQIKVSLDEMSDIPELSAAFHGSDLSSSNYARLTVSDNGHGMTDEVRRRMFEPYFSTKKALGTGLGLATVSQIVMQFGGAITVESEVGVGTRICVYLPAVESKAEAYSKSETGGKALQGGREKILIVDDEYPVRNVLCVSLEHLGYDVDVASGGAEAIEKFQQADPKGFDLVILDMIMPKMSGDKVFARLKDLDPNVRVLVISGYSSESAVQSILDNGGLDFMPKPFTIEELSKKVRQCLELVPAR
jgi:two-component system cell cycle sensor histidine kinase/response regulator CckA